MPLIVTLEIDVVPEGDLPPEARAAQQERIAETRRALLDELAGMRVENVAEFRAVPQVTMTVGPDALELLERSPNVRFIAEDVPNFSRIARRSSQRKACNEARRSDGPP